MTESPPPAEIQWADVVGLGVLRDEVIAARLSTTPMEVRLARKRLGITRRTGPTGWRRRVDIIARDPAAASIADVVFWSSASGIRADAPKQLGKPRTRVASELTCEPLGARCGHYTPKRTRATSRARQLGSMPKRSTHIAKPPSLGGCVEHCRAGTTSGGRTGTPRTIRRPLSFSRG